MRVVMVYVLAKDQEQVPVARDQHPVQARDAGHAYGCAVSNMALNSTSDLFALPRLTIRRSVTASTFQQIVHGRVPMMLRKDRALTKGWAMVRRTRQRWMR